MFANIFGKPWHESLTAWGLILVVASRAAETSGLLPLGVTEAALTLADSIGQVLIVLGIRKAAGTATVKK